jgi:TrwC relaxase
MDRSTFPFPLAANSSHHSHYHRFLLGADPSILAPLPKPFCMGALSGSMPLLTERLDLPRWRKLFHGAIPWVEGFGPRHYDLGCVAPHRPLPLEYGRPLRRFGAYDFVQAADPSMSALGLVAGDRRVIDSFTLLVNDFCAKLEPGVGTRAAGPSGARLTARMLAGEFVEPNNRWLMPFLHAHVRVLNFTAFEEAPSRLACIDHAVLARAGERARRQWVGRQAAALSELGYRVAVCGDEAPSLCVDGVSGRLVAAMEAPRIAVLRMLERIILGNREPSVDAFTAELPSAVIAAMAEQLESALARSLSFYKPPKIGIPSEGPWRSAVREHMSRTCPQELALLDAAAARARSVPYESALFSTPQLDPAHCHAPRVEALEAADQLPGDPELGAASWDGRPARAASPWLANEFAATLTEVNDRLVHVGPDDPLLSLRRVLATIDQLPDGADPDRLMESARFLGIELDRRARQFECGPELHGHGGRADRAPLASLDELIGRAELVCEREIGGRGL